jgi:hypothetical protein
MLHERVPDNILVVIETFSCVYISYNMIVHRSLHSCFSLQHVFRYISIFRMFLICMILNGVQLYETQTFASSSLRLIDILRLILIALMLSINDCDEQI